MRINRLSLAMLVILAAGCAAAQASACITVGVYQDDPAQSWHALTKSTGPGVSAISTYITAGQALAPDLIATANRYHDKLVVTWLPDGGRDGANQPKFRLKSVAEGRYDKSLKALVAQLHQVRKGAVLRPMPEMNTPWYAWSGAANGNTPAQYVAAWRRVRHAVRAARGGSHVPLLWAPYAQSIPTTGANQLGNYFPGASQVDLVGVSAYNFGAAGGLSWTDPGALFSSAYALIEAMAAKPFWIAETGSTASGGDKAAWIRTLGTLRLGSMPRLAGVVWYDIRDSDGDFRLGAGAVTSAFRALLKGACR
jgi:mannan endo-1,4-beta-mannosidase